MGSELSLAENPRFEVRARGGQFPGQVGQPHTAAHARAEGAAGHFAHLLALVVYREAGPWGAAEPLGRASLGVDDGVPLAAVVGLLNRAKGQDLALRALADA